MLRLSDKVIKVLKRSYSSAITSASTNIMSNKDFSKRLVWIDLEMTGLDDTKDKILEAACIVTDGDLNIVAEGPDLIIHQSDEVLDTMNEWCIKTHGESGLTEASRKSNVSVTDAENLILEFVKKHTNPGQSPLAGNSVGEDKRFLNRYMPRLIEHLHYRIVDVSTVKELAKRWYPNFEAPKKSDKHRALDDIRESIEELRAYRQNIFK